RDMKSQITVNAAYREPGSRRKPEPPAEIEPINRVSMAQRVPEALRDLIGGGQLPQGTPLVQRDLAQRLGVSQTPVRQGLALLEHAGLVEVGETGRGLVRRLP